MNKSEQSLLAQVAKRPDLFEDSFYSFAKLMHPRFYLDDREYLIDMCNRLQAFIYGNDKRFLVMTVPPRHGKSLTAQDLTAWLFGLDNRNKVMTGSYNERLSGIFARSVRNMIQTEGVGNNIVYGDIFPDTKVKYGEASASMWSLAGSDEVNYLATSPGATATGLGVNTLIIDDIIKSADEAYNENRLQDLWEWYNNTMMQRLEGDWRVIIIMTRWATGDLAGRVLADYGDKVEHISYSAVQPDGSMLCDAVLDAETFVLKTQEMNPDIIEANYNQKPIDIRGRLYPTLNTYELETLVETDAWKNAPVQAICDTADAGTDYLCLMAYKVIDNEAYIIDTVFTQEDMDTTEELVADSLYLNDVKNATFEANNGGRLFSKNVEKRIASKYGSNKTVIETVTQSSNKEARIMTSSAWVNKHVYMPLGWRNKWRDLHDNITSYQAKGKNKHDDACFPAGTMVATTRGNVPIEEVSIGDKVITPIGVREVTDSRMTGVRKVISRGGLTATPDHKVWDGQKFTKLDALTGIYDIMSISGGIRWKYKKLLYSMEQPISSWGRERITLVNQVPIKDERVLKDFMSRCGSIIQERKYRKAIKFTILTATLLITTILTYSVFHLKNTQRYISHKATGLKASLRSMLYRKPLNGIGVKRAEIGTLSKQRKTGRIANQSQKNVYFAKKNTKRHSQTLSTAQITVASNSGEEVANETTVASVQKTSQNSTPDASNALKSAKTKQSASVNVYNITVAEAGCYYANGILVANCDVLAYIFESITDKKELVFYGSLDRGAEPGRGVFSR